jgi:di/tricarboxylate transporter
VTAEIAITLGTLLLVLFFLVREALSPDVLLLAALGFLMAVGIVPLEEGLAGFAEPTLLALGSLFVVAAGLRSTGALVKAAELLFGGFERLRPVLLRLVLASGISSAFLNNTPIVAMGISSVLAWTRERAIPASKLLIPLSYASILGGICTLIGTSTNLVADGLLRQKGYEGLGFFELGMLGIPLAVAGLAYLVLIAPRFLPDRTDVEANHRGAKVSGRGVQVLRVGSSNRWEGGSVEELRLNTPSMALIRVVRDSGEVVQPHPDTRILAGDRLVFRADPRSLASLAERLDLKQVDVSEEGDEGGPVELREAVIPEGSVLEGERVGKVNFPGRYGARVVAVLRHGVELAENPDALVLRAGDTLYLAGSPGFTEAFQGGRDFYLMGSEAMGEEKEKISLWRPTEAKAGLLILALVVGLATTRVLHISLAALLGAIVMVGLKLVTPAEARRSVDWSVLIVIGAAIGLGRALEFSGTAEWVGRGLVAMGAPLGGMGILAATLVACMVFTLTITNNAAVALIFPVAVSAATSQGLEVRPFIVAITVGASLAFATPLGYQTNLMVYGPGGYRFRDFVRAGLPLQLLLAALAVILIPLIWPLT